MTFSSVLQRYGLSICMNWQLIKEQLFSLLTSRLEKHATTVVKTRLLNKISKDTNEPEALTYVLEEWQSWVKQWVRPISISQHPILTGHD